MKKQWLLIHIIMLTLLSCSPGKRFPELVDEVPQHHPDEDFQKSPLLQDYLAYKDATTKNSKVIAPIKQKDIKYPWDTDASDTEAESILTQIEQNIQAAKNAAADVNKEAASSILLISRIKSSPADEQEYKEKGLLKNKKSLLDDIKGKVIGAQLFNEKNEKVDITNEFLGTTQGGLEEFDGKMYGHFGFQTLGLSNEYSTLKGFIEIEIEIPVQFDHKEIDDSDVGTALKINGQKIEILELDQNTLHFVLRSGSSPDFNIYFDNCNNAYSSGIGIPESLYKTFRKNQSLSYENFVKKYKALGLVRDRKPKDENTVWIYKSDNCKIGKVFFYAPNKSKTLKKTIKVPIDIK